MTPAVNKGMFQFTKESTIGDLLLVAEALRKAGKNPTLRFVKSYNDEIESVAVDIEAKPDLPPEARDRMRAWVADIKQDAIDEFRAKTPVAGAEAPSHDHDHDHECKTRENSVCEDRGYCECECGVVRIWHGGCVVPRREHWRRVREMAVGGNDDDLPDSAEGRLP